MHNDPGQDPPAVPSAYFSADACSLLGGAVERYTGAGGIPPELSSAAATICREAHNKGLTVDAVIREVRIILERSMARQALTPSDRAALMALVVDECVRAFYVDR
ncbi:MAG TPA: hypothetical protein VJU87_12610 [Gemmatimonadaceae bacterium]|nr:hypothetical protein [Gemmatimonadaceae bacterium]